MLNRIARNSALGRSGAGKSTRKLIFRALKKAAPKTRITGEFLLVLNTYVTHSEAKITGYDIIHGNNDVRGTDLKSGTVYPMLYRMEKKGWLKLEREVFDHTKELPRRPPRNYYRITETGFTSGKKLLLERDEQLQKLLTISTGGYREAIA